MKKILFISFIALFASCDDRFNFLSSYNNPPSIGFGEASTTGKSGNRLVHVDSMKTSFKHGSINYGLPLTISDPDNNLKSITAGVFNGSAQLYLGTDPVPNPIPTGINNYGFILNQVKDGPIVVIVNATDAFDVTATFELDLFAFDNMLPVASFTATNSNINGDSYEYVFDGSSSYDKDRIYGGGIQSYTWTINGVTLPPVTQSSINQVFPGPGGYQVSLVVNDNDGAPSPAVTKSITVK